MTTSPVLVSMHAEPAQTAVLHAHHPHSHPQHQQHQHQHRRSRMLFGVVVIGLVLILVLFWVSYPSSSSSSSSQHSSASCPTVTTTPGASASHASAPTSSPHQSILWVRSGAGNTDYETQRQRVIHLCRMYLIRYNKLRRDHADETALQSNRRRFLNQLKCMRLCVADPTKTLPLIECIWSRYASRHRCSSSKLQNRERILWGISLLLAFVVHCRDRDEDGCGDDSDDSKSSCPRPCPSPESSSSDSDCDSDEADGNPQVRPAGRRAGGGGGSGAAGPSNRTAPPSTAASSSSSSSSR